MCNFVVTTQGIRRWVDISFVMTVCVCGGGTGVEGSLSDLQQAKATMFYNLATVFCVLKEHDKAKQSLHKVRHAYSAQGKTCRLAAIIISINTDEVSAMMLNW